MSIKFDLMRKSIPASTRVCGYTVKKLTVGKFLHAAKIIETMPQEFISACFPNMPLDGVLCELSGISTQKLQQIISTAFEVAPIFLVSTISELSGIPKDELLNSEKIGIDGLVSIAAAVWEVNRLGEAASGARDLVAQIKGTPPLK